MTFESPLLRGTGLKIIYILRRKQVRPGWGACPTSCSQCWTEPGPPPGPSSPTLWGMPTILPRLAPSCGRQAWLIQESKSIKGRTGLAYSWQKNKSLLHTLDKLLMFSENLPNNVIPKHSSTLTLVPDFKIQPSHYYETPNQCFL